MDEQDGSTDSRALITFSHVLAQAHTSVVLTFSIDDAHEEHAMILLVRGVEAALHLLVLRSLHLDVRGINDSNAVMELIRTSGVSDPVHLLVP